MCVPDVTRGSVTTDTDVAWILALYLQLVQWEVEVHSHAYLYADDGVQKIHKAPKRFLNRFDKAGNHVFLLCNTVACS